VKGEGQCVTTSETSVSIPAGPEVGTISSSGQHHLDMPTPLRIGGNPSDARFIAKPANCTEIGHSSKGLVCEVITNTPRFTGNSPYSIQPYCRGRGILNEAVRRSLGPGDRGAKRSWGGSRWTPAAHQSCGSLAASAITRTSIYLLFRRL
jgi:hypothetical protein